MTGMKDSGDIYRADKSTMLASIDAMVHGTVFDGSFATEWCWSKGRNYYPETLVPTEMFDHKDHRAEWLTFKNINQWIDGAEHILLDLRFVKDEPCTFPGK